MKTTRLTGLGVLVLVLAACGPAVPLLHYLGVLQDAASRHVAPLSVT